MDDDQRIIQATYLPDGWEWRLYDDGSGGLYSPENKKVVEVDFATSEYRSEGKWHFLSGYPYETVSSSEFMDSMEKDIRSTLERKGKLNNPLINAFVTSKHSRQDGCTVTFPTTPEQLRAALKTDNIEACQVSNFSCASMPELSRFLGSDTTLDELQYVAVKIVALTSDERVALSAYLERDYPFDEITVKNLMDAIENIHTFNLDKSIMTEEALGRSILEARLEVCQPAIDTLSRSSDIPEQNLVDYIKTLEEHIDAAAFGRAHMAQNDMLLTSKGVMGVDWQDFFWRQDRQVPDEYRLTGKVKPSLLQTLETNKAIIAQRPPAEKHKKDETSL